MVVMKYRVTGLSNCYGIDSTVDAPLGPSRGPVPSNNRTARVRRNRNCCVRALNSARDPMAACSMSEIACCLQELYPSRRLRLSQAILTGLAVPYKTEFIFLGLLPEHYTMLNESDKNNIETVKSMYESFAEGDIDAMVAAWAPDIELHEPEELVKGGTFHGPDDIIENVFTRLANDWEELSVVPEQFVDGGDTIVALLNFSGTYIKTGKSAEFQGAHVFEFSDGKIARWTSYADTTLFNAAHEA